MKKRISTVPFFTIPTEKEVQCRKDSLQSKYRIKPLTGSDQRKRLHTGLFCLSRKSGLRDSPQQTFGVCRPRVCSTQTAPRTPSSVSLGPPTTLAPPGAEATDRLDSRFLLVHCQGPRVGGHGPGGGRPTWETHTAPSAATPAPARLQAPDPHSREPEAAVHEDDVSSLTSPFRAARGFAPPLLRLLAFSADCLRSGLVVT